MAEEIINKVAKANIVQIDLSDFLNKESLLIFDLKQALWQEMIIKEDHFRDFIKDFDWSIYTDKSVAVYCSEDAIIPAWSFMLVATKLKEVNANINFGDLNEVQEIVFFENLSKINLNELEDQRVMVKGCSSVPNPNRAYVELTNLLVPKVKSLMFGEPCSAVPVYKRR
jgi:hypothetical protein